MLGQVELADDRERIDARSAVRAEHFGNHAFAVADRRGKADHLEDHFVVGPGGLGAGVAHINRLGKERAVDLNVGRAGGLEIGADEIMRLAIDDLDDFAAGPAGRAPAVVSCTSTTSPLAASPVDFLRNVDICRARPAAAPRPPAAGAASGRTKPKPFARDGRRRRSRGCAAIPPRGDGLRRRAADAFGLPRPCRIKCLGRKRFAHGGPVA